MVGRVAKLLIVTICLRWNWVESIPLDDRDANCQTTCGAIENGTKTNVHIIPHSHDDVGWLKTVDQYYYGTHKEIQNAGVQYIISAYVEALKSNPDRRFVQVETMFLWKWWQNQNDIVKRDFINLVNNGQIEIISGGWSMNDEAATNYQSIIDQFTWGFRKLDEMIGKCARPKIGWQIDPFGHSREHASILKQFGFNGLIIGRLDYNDKAERIKNKNLDFLWNTTSNSEHNLLFTSMFPSFYGSIGDFNWDITYTAENAPPPINDNESSPDYNLRVNVDKFAAHMKEYETYYKTKNILVPLGGDFEYQAAEMNFLNIDKLIKGFKNHPDYNVFYSTPSCYIQSVNNAVMEDKIKLTVKQKDFFPYSSDPHAFWGGYFTSRPTLKKLDRIANNILQSAKQLASFSKIIKDEDTDDSLDDLRETLGILQHHDAITGTAKDVVTKDYVRMISAAIEKVQNSMSTVITNLLKKDDKNEIDLKLAYCLLANISICENSGKDKFWVSVYNPLAQSVSHPVRLPVQDGKFKVTDPNNNDAEVQSQSLDSLSTFEFVQLPDQKILPKELVFVADDVPPMGLKMYYVEKVTATTTQIIVDVEVPTEYGTKESGFTINNDTGLLDTVTINGKKLEVSQQFLYYNGHDGNSTEFELRASGAYIFRPESGETNEASKTRPTISGIKGAIVDEFKQIFKDSGITQIIRAYKNESYIEFDWLVGDLKIDEGKEGKEIITKFTIKNLVNNKTFFTDSNGREQIERIINAREDYDYNATQEPVASNYYPVPSKIVLNDSDKKLRVAVFTDRAQGGTSLKDGEVELMIHRRLTKDDNFGVQEALDEKEFGKGLYVRGQHFLTFESAAYERIFAQRKLKSPWIMVADATSDDLSLENMKKTFNFIFSGLSKDLPSNLNFLTFEPWTNDTYILRLEHIMEKGEDDKLSNQIKLNIKDVFSKFDLKEITETVLGANQKMSEYNQEKHLTWNEAKMKQVEAADSVDVTLLPMQIRTFLVKAGPKKNGPSGHGSMNPTINYLIIGLSVIYFLLFN